MPESLVPMLIVLLLLPATADTQEARPHDPSHQIMRMNLVITMSLATLPSFNTTTSRCKMSGAG